MWSKAKIFVVDAGKVIMIISLILWALSSFGPQGRMQQARASYEQKLAAPNADTIQAKNEYANTKLVNSYVGIIGKSIEPVIAPLGYDWRIGIAIITSFAAREVFVGTMKDISLIEAKTISAINIGVILFTFTLLCYTRIPSPVIVAACLLLGYFF